MKRRARGHNPLSILVVTLCLLIPVLLAYDHTTPVVFLFLGLGNLVYLGGVNLKSFFKTLSILSLVSVGLFGLNILFPAEGVDGLSRGVAVFLRSLCLISLSIGYIFVVDPYDLFRSLMINLSLSPRIGFALFAGWNTIPLLRRDLKIIERAQALRFGAKKRASRDRFRTPISLLAGAVRHGERVSLSMAARGIESTEKRTFIKESKWAAADTVYCVLGALVSAGAFLVIARHGLFHFDLG